MRRHFGAVRVGDEPVSWLGATAWRFWSCGPDVDA
jgi:hypothetical protein